MTEHTIGSLAREVGVNVETVRFYEREGLLVPTARTGRGWRRYDEGALATIRFIKGAQRMGFALAEIGALLKRRGDDGEMCIASREAGERKLEEVEQRILELEAVRTFLRRELDACASPNQCKVVETLEGEEK